MIESGYSDAIGNPGYSEYSEPLYPEQDLEQDEYGYYEYKERSDIQPSRPIGEPKLRYKGIQGALLFSFSTFFLSKDRIRSHGM